MAGQPMRLGDIITRSQPLPWSEGDNIPWNDPDFSSRMLIEHLTQGHDAAIWDAGRDYTRRVWRRLGIRVAASPIRRHRPLMPANMRGSNNLTVPTGARIFAAPRSARDTTWRCLSMAR